MKYFNPPPQIKYNGVKNVPAFVAKWYNAKKPLINLEYILELFGWAEQEYADTVAYCLAIGDEKTTRMLRKTDSLRVLAFSRRVEFDTLSGARVNI
jgi:hypothetical protein